ncbi:MAG: hypothetical protein ACI9NQ_000226 [Paracoccaceae bacterium]|jgi:hypothetical protein
MNTTNILLGTTSLLLVVGFALSFSGFSKGRDSESNKEELAELRTQLAKIDAEDRAFERSRLRARSGPYLPPAPINPISTPVAPVAPAPPADMDAISKLQDKIDALEDENEVLANEKEGLEKESVEINAERKGAQDKQKMAAFRIENALTMGTVSSASKEYGQVIFTPSPSGQFQPGKILAVRRNTGIIGKIQIDRLDDSGDYVASMRPHGYSPDGFPDIQPGDTIITDFGK